MAQLNEKVVRNRLSEKTKFFKNCESIRIDPIGPNRSEAILGNLIRLLHVPFLFASCSRCFLLLDEQANRRRRRGGRRRSLESAGRREESKEEIRERER